MNWIDRLQALAFRLYGAAVVFWLAGAALDSVTLLQYMAMCVFFALLMLPLRLLKLTADLVELYFEWRGQAPTYFRI